MKPYKFQPYLRTTIWGGYQIAPFKGIYTAQPNIGESWEISSVLGHESVAVERGIIGDVDLGLNLTQLIDKYKGLLVGERGVYPYYTLAIPSASPCAIISTLILSLPIPSYCYLFRLFIFLCRLPPNPIGRFLRSVRFA